MILELAILGVCSAAVAVALVASGAIGIAKTLLGDSRQAFLRLSDPLLEDIEKERMARAQSIALVKGLGSVLWRLVAALAVGAAPALLAIVAGLTSYTALDQAAWSVAGLAVACVAFVVVALVPR